MEIKKRYNIKAVAFFITFFLLVVLRTGFAQDTTSDPASGAQPSIKAGLGAGTAKNFGIYFSVSPSEKRFYTFDFNHISRNPTYLPQNYHGEFLCFFGDCIPNEEISYITVFAGHYFISKHKARFGIAGGPSLVLYRKVVFEEINNPRDWLNLGPNYNISYSNRIGAGIGLKTIVEFRIAQSLWLEPAFYANINTRHTTYSGNLYLNFEWPLKARKR
jgi:hypothetical protein